MENTKTIQKHTPGPWSVDIHKNIGNWTWRIRGPSTPGIPGRQVAEVNKHGVPEQVEQDAHLIAAAPDLLTCADEMVTLADAALGSIEAGHFHGNQTAVETLKRHLEKYRFNARAAIAKATGTD